MCDWNFTMEIENNAVKKIRIFLFVLANKVGEILWKSSWKGLINRDTCAPYSLVFNYIY